jgi:hypothetical protein
VQSIKQAAEFKGFAAGDVVNLKVELQDDQSGAFSLLRLEENTRWTPINQVQSIDVTTDAETIDVTCYSQPQPQRMVVGPTRATMKVKLMLGDVVQFADVEIDGPVEAADEAQTTFKFQGYVRATKTSSI